MQYWVLQTNEDSNLKPSSTEPLSNRSEPSTVKESDSQQLVQNSTGKEGIPVATFGVVLTGALALITTLVVKWRDAEISRIESAKNAEVKQVKTELESEIKLLSEKNARDISGKDNEIAILQSKIDSLEEKNKELQEFTSIFPQEFFLKTKGALEEVIRELKLKIEALEKDKENISQQNKELQIELKSKLLDFQSELSQVSAFEKYLSDRSIDIHRAKLWISTNQTRLAEEVSTNIRHTSMQEIGTAPVFNHEQLSRFTADIQDYLGIVEQCLSLGRPDLLRKVKAEIPNIVSPIFYAHAFRIIRDEKAPSELSNPRSEKEVGLYLNYLIQLFEDEIT